MTTSLARGIGYSPLAIRQGLFQDQQRVAAPDPPTPASPAFAQPALVGGIDPYPELPACAGCGRCCHLVVELRPGDVVPEELVTEHAGARCMDQRGNGACVALDPVTFLCTIYEQRPQTCRDFSRGSEICRRILGRP